MQSKKRLIELVRELNVRAGVAPGTFTADGEDERAGLPRIQAFARQSVYCEGVESATFNPADGVLGCAHLEGPSVRGVWDTLRPNQAIPSPAEMVRYAKWMLAFGVDQMFKKDPAPPALGRTSSDPTLPHPPRPFSASSPAGFHEDRRSNKIEEARRYILAGAPKDLTDYPHLAAESGISAPDARQLADLWLRLGGVRDDVYAQIRKGDKAQTYTYDAQLRRSLGIPNSITSPLADIVRDSLARRVMVTDAIVENSGIGADAMAEASYTRTNIAGRNVWVYDDSPVDPDEPMQISADDIYDPNLIDQQPIGHSLPFRIPPIHRRCRSVLQPVMVNISDLPPELQWLVPDTPEKN